MKALTKAIMVTKSIILTEKAVSGMAQMIPLIGKANRILADSWKDLAECTSRVAARCRITNEKLRASQKEMEAMLKN